jgi:hypothetical protein
MSLNAIVEKGHDIFLGNNMVRNTLFVLFSIMLGYVLYPVPKTLDNLFYQSNIFKYIIIFMVMVTTMNVKDMNTLIICIIVPALVLGLLEFLRYADIQYNAAVDKII